jgi:hypothetical protein
VLTPSCSHRRLTARLLPPAILGFTIAAIGAPGQGGGVAAQAPSACGLLTTDEVRALAPNTEVHDGVAGSSPSLELFTCRYSWGGATKASALVISINPASRMFVGLTPDSIKQRLASLVVPETDDAAIPDVGEGAVFKAYSPYYVTASAYLKGRVLQLNLDGYSARERKGQLLSLLKSAASRL